jgi:hypothetical protein
MSSSLSDRAQKVVYEDDVAVVLVDGAPSKRTQAWVVPKARRTTAGVDERTGMHLFKLGMRAAQSLLMSASDEVQVLLEGLTTADPHVLVRILPRGSTAR